MGVCKVFVTPEPGTWLLLFSHRAMFIIMKSYMLQIKENKLHHLLVCGLC